MQTTDDHELNMPDLLAQELLQMLNQQAAEIVSLKKLTENFVNLLVAMFQADLEQANCHHDIQAALNDLSQRLSPFTDAS